jgi:hypothetical protein
MNRLRFTIAGLMGIVLFVAVGFAALRNANAFWASGTYSVAIMMILVASLGAFARKGKARMTWAGFALFGWAYHLLSALPMRAVGVFGDEPIRWPDLPMALAMSYLYPYIEPPSGFLVEHDQVIYSLQLILFSLVGTVVGRLVAVKDDQPIPS